MRAFVCRFFPRLFSSLGMSPACMKLRPAQAPHDRQSARRAPLCFSVSPLFCRMRSYNRILPAMAVLTNQIWIVKVQMFTAPPNPLAAQCVRRPLECVSDLTLFIPLSVGTSQSKDEMIKVACLCPHVLSFVGKGIRLHVERSLWLAYQTFGNTFPSFPDRKLNEC
jgi:hypothetical protein